MADALAQLQQALEGHYRVEHELGAGGMATVYLAHDERHDRPVAIKVLRPELAAILGGQRFLAEIKTTANLQHPHILSLYDSGEADGLVFYVMPYVQGESLRDRLAREKQLPVEDAVRIAREVASALDYAHRHGVVHRDIKPENILLHDGQALVADFGIALAVSSAGGTRITETGMSLGTPHYMSPEQAMGEREITARSDVYALGCVVYEMLLGEPPFTGPTAQAIVAKVMTDEPRPITIHRRTVPVHVEAAVLTALAKLPADRFATAAQFAEALAHPTAVTEPASVATARVVTPTPGRERAFDWRIVAGAAGVLVALGFLVGRLWRAAPPLTGPGRFAIQVEPVTSLANNFAPGLALDRSGRLIAFVGRGPRGTRIFIRALSDSLPRPVAGTDNGVAPFFSPDGRWLGFVMGDHLMKVPVEGGVPSEVADSAGVFAAWTDDGSVVYTDPPGTTLRVVLPSGTRRVVSRPDTVRFLSLSPLPGRRMVLAGLLGGGRSRTAIAAVSLVDGAMRDIGLPDVLMAKYVPSGILVYQRRLGGPLYAATFDPRRLRLTGPAAQTIAPEARITFRVIPKWDVADRSLVYVKPEPFQLVLADRSGRAAVLKGEPRSYHHPRFSPDGRRITFDITEGQERDVWVLDVGDHTMTRLTVGEIANDPFWSPDGRRLAYTAVRGAVRGLFVRNADGSGAAESVLADLHDRSSGSWAPDGRTIVSSTSGLAGLEVVPLTGTRRAQPIAGSRPSEAYPALSPDGRWLAYVSDESGRLEVYVRPFPGPGGRRQVSTDGGSEAVWTRGGRELIYREDGGAGSRLIAVAVRTSPTLEVGTRTPLFDVSSYVNAEDHANYDVDRGGNRFVLVHSPQASQIQLLLDWSSLLREGVSHKR